jgi:hypothetical protein
LEISIFQNSAIKNPNNAYFFHFEKEFASKYNKIHLSNNQNFLENKQKIKKQSENYL